MLKRDPASGASKLRVCLSYPLCPRTGLVTDNSPRDEALAASQSSKSYGHLLAMGIRIIEILASACLLVQGAVAISTPTLGNLRRDDSAAAIPPSQDPWYTAPDGYESASPGAILRNRTAPSSVLQAVGSNCSAAYQLLYRTTASQGNATFAVTTVLVPQDPTTALLSYQIPYDSAYINSSPSYTLSQQVDSDIKVALGKGYFVTVPDYEGPLASFTAGHMSGYATLDAVRATLNGADLYGLLDDTLYATWGYSGGALATEWAAELQADYASELSFAGSAMGGLTPNVTSVLETINMKISAGLAPVSCQPQHPLFLVISHGLSMETIFPKSNPAALTDPYKNSLQLLASSANGPPPKNGFTPTSPPTLLAPTQRRTSSPPRTTPSRRPSPPTSSRTSTATLSTASRTSPAPR